LVMGGGGCKKGLKRACRSLAGRLEVRPAVSLLDRSELSTYSMRGQQSHYKKAARANPAAPTRGCGGQLSVAAHS
jgi:hypothetical protein